MIKAVIIDDVAKAIKTLQSDLRDYCPNVEIIGTADGVVNGAKLVNELKPELIFLDIQMQDGSGFDLLEIIPHAKAKVIFTTASDEFAIKAFRYAAVDYLLKPVDPEELMDAVTKYKSGAVHNGEIDLLKSTLEEKSLPDRVALHTSEKIHLVELKDIIRCASDGNYTEFHFSSGDKLLVTKTLKEFDNLFEGAGFLRVHQSHLINTSHVEAYIKTEGGYIVMKDQSRIPVSVRKKAAVVKALSMLK